MNLLDELEGFGVDVAEGLDRVMGDKDLYQMMLGMFITAVKSDPIQPEDFDGADLDGLIKRVHTLKGTAGNLSLLPLFKRYTEMLNLLREGKPGEAKEVFVRTVPIQTNIVDCIQRHQGA